MLTVVASVATAPAAAQTGTEVYNESWESGNFDGYTVTQTAGNYEFTTSESTDGSTSLHTTSGDSSGEIKAEYDTMYNFSGDGDTVVEFDVKHQSDTVAGYTSLRLVDNATGDEIIIRSRGSSDDDSGTDQRYHYWQVRGSMVDNAQYETEHSGEYPLTVPWTALRGEIDYANDEVRLYADDSLVLTTNLTKEWTGDTKLVHVHATTGFNGITGGQDLWTDDFSVQRNAFSDTVTGTVTDTSGNALDSATVSLENTATGDTTTTQTDANGDFSAYVPDGTYEVTISKAGYQTLTETHTVSDGAQLGTFQLEPANLDLDFNRYQKPGETQTYTIKWTNENGNEKDVTGDSNLSVTSSNTSIITVSGNELVAAEGVNGTSTINVSYTAPDGSVYTDAKNVTVAQPTMENLEILPGIWRFSAVIGDPTFQVMFIGTLVAIVGTRGASAFAGLSLMEMTMVIGFLGGWVGLGMVLVSTFAAIFLGLNLAANIDYSVRR